MWRIGQRPDLPAFSEQARGDVPPGVAKSSGNNVKLLGINLKRKAYVRLRQGVRLWRCLPPIEGLQHPRPKSSKRGCTEHSNEGDRRARQFPRYRNDDLGQHPGTHSCKGARFNDQSSKTPNGKPSPVPRKHQHPHRPAGRLAPRRRSPNQNPRVGRPTSPDGQRSGRGASRRAPRMRLRQFHTTRPLLRSLVWSSRAAPKSVDGRHAFAGLRRVPQVTLET